MSDCFFCDTPSQTTRCPLDAPPPTSAILDAQRMSALYTDLGSSALPEAIQVFFDDVRDRLHRMTRRNGGLGALSVFHDAHAVFSGALSMGFDAIEKEAESLKGICQSNAHDEIAQQIHRLRCAACLTYHAIGGPEPASATT